MSKRTILTCFLLLLTVYLSAQHDAMQRINRAATAIKTMQGDFVQTKQLKLLNDQMVSKGRMCYQGGDKLRWEYVTPYSYVFIMNGSQVQLKNSTRSDVIDVNQNKIFKEIAQIMMNSVVGKCLQDDKSFKTTIQETASEYVATLLPLKKNMKQMFQQIVLHFQKQQSVVSKVELLEKNGDRTMIELKNIRLNETIPAREFAVR
ncbi:MAG: outer membrane lipoprotein carrier protein LolA [Bacteroidales bacterium]|nr:outer membrane lipoprotein carrier protein LolA [Bacteroidales bacterium]